ncbi:MAG: MFS transporter [Acidimicrobiales bacterium]
MDTVPPSSQEERSISSGMVALLAVSCGLAVANLYYAQPLLATIARTFHTTPGIAAFVVTASQLGYGVGLALLVPLGDLLERRRLVALVLVGTAAALAMAAVAPDMYFLMAAAALIGVTAVVAQVLVPFAAHLAADAQRGRVVGTVMSGLLIGILLGRVVAGAIAEIAGWRTIYAASAVWIAVLAIVLRRMLPPEQPTVTLSYRRLLGSVVSLARTEPVLRRRSLYGALTFACFNVLWTSLAFLLSAAPYRYPSVVIGLFGLLGAGGAMAAGFAGRLADREMAPPLTGITLATVAGSFGLLALGAHHLWALVAGIVLLDIGAQATHIFNQHLILRLHPESRSRLNTVYMVAYFAGGSLGSLGTGLAFGAWGWKGVCMLGGALGVSAVSLWVAEQVSRSTRGTRSARCDTQGACLPSSPSPESATPPTYP